MRIQALLNGVLLLTMGAAWAAPPYDFDRLQQEVAVPKGPYVIKDVARTAFDELLRFSKVDELREDDRVARARSRSNTPPPSDSPSSSSTASSSSKTRASSSKVFVCKIYCVSGSGPVVYRETSAIDRYEAARNIESVVDEVCKADGYKRGSSVNFNPNQCSAK